VRTSFIDWLHCGQSAKLEAFTNSLSPDEISLFKWMLERGSLSESDLNKVTGGTARTSLAATAPQLNAGVFNKLMCW
jgi:hypothetical protein